MERTASTDNQRLSAYLLLLQPEIYSLFVVNGVEDGPLLYPAQVGGGEAVLGKVSLIEDCRAVVCKKIGFQAQKQFEKKAISVFDVEVSVEEALDKISTYFYKIDSRQSLRASRAVEEKE